jgi:hypothetical protein
LTRPRSDPASARLAIERSWRLPNGSLTRISATLAAELDTAVLGEALLTLRPEAPGILPTVGESGMDEVAW